MVRYKITLEYDGTPFVGWQEQQNQISVQSVVEKALKTYLRQETKVVASGRTDTGVHALGQVAHFDSPQKLNSRKAIYSLNALMRPYPVAIRKMQKVSDDFHARFDAQKRTYLYRIQNTAFPPVLNKNRVWHVNQKLDIKKMNQAAQMLIGKHDFSTFRAANCQAKSPIKTLDSLVVKRVGEEVQITVSAKSFLYHQVRNFAGALVKVGLNRWSLDDFEKAFRACDRTKGAETAPAQGLYFMKVEY
ncbi:MAG: tRNA pseudouridine(38-40) synthase TruA [Alphaproteobacteria bacterium]|nr:tRNA pseudouridine(38-40) synthase TruA [Alphaproteobacteria bacterium]